MKTREKFQSIFEVASYEADQEGRFSLFSLFNRFQELAGNHADFLGVGYNDLRTMNLAWILSRIDLRIESMPAWGQTVTLSTWPKGVDRMFAMRDFRLAGDNDETLVLASSAWLLFDIEKSRPRKIESLSTNLQFPGAPHAVRETPDKIRLPEGMEPAGERRVWPSDIDTNRHVNNAQYAKWVIDCFPEREFSARRLASVQINYLEETTIGDSIAFLKAPRDPAASEHYVAGISRSRGSAVFQARVAWE